MPATQTESSSPWLLAVIIASIALGVGISDSVREAVDGVPAVLSTVTGASKRAVELPELAQWVLPESFAFLPSVPPPHEANASTVRSL